jgi:TPR repeat protein
VVATVCTSEDLEMKAQAYFLLGTTYLPEEPKKCCEHTAMAASFGNTTASLLVAEAYEKNSNSILNPSGEVNYPMAIKFYEQEASGLGMYRIARIYQNGGYGVLQDSVKATEYYTRSASLGNTQSLMIVASCYLNGGESQGLNIELNQMEGHKILDNLIAKEDYNAMKEKSICHWQGIGIPVNIEKASHLMHLSAYGGCVGSMLILALCCEEGDALIRKGSRLSYGKEALRWFSFTINTYCTPEEPINFNIKSYSCTRYRYALAESTGFYPEGATKLQENGMPG